MTFNQRKHKKAIRFKKGLVGGIYCWKNMVNGKELIGQTKHFPIRKGDYKSKKKAGNIAFRTDVKKYGWSNFKVFCLNTATNPDIRNRLETFYILRRNSLTPNGYNQNTGGDCYEFTDEWREKVRIGKEIWKQTDGYQEYLKYVESKRVRKICEYCGKLFHSQSGKTSKRRFCSPKCSKIFLQSEKGKDEIKQSLVEYSKSTREIRTCPTCGREFECYKKDTKVYCYQKCKPNKPQKLVYRICKFCGKEYSTIRSIKKVFCSKECSVAFRQSEEGGIKSMEIAKEKGFIKRVTKTCELCGKEFERTPSRMKNQRFCSHECGMKSHKGNPIFIESLTKANRKTGQREDIRKQRSENAKKRWQDPAYRKKMKKERVKREVRLCTRCDNTFLVTPKQYKKKCDECIKKSKE